MSVLPTRTDLQRLSVWGRVKFAVLCARRAQQLVTISWKGALAQHVEAIDAALAFAESASNTAGNCFFLIHVMEHEPFDSDIFTLNAKVLAARRQLAVVAEVTNAGVNEAHRLSEAAAQVAVEAKSADAAKASLAALAAARCAVMVMSGLLADVGKEEFDIKAAEQAANVAHLAAFAESCETNSFAEEVIIDRTVIAPIRSAFDALLQEESHAK